LTAVAKSGILLPMYITDQHITIIITTTQIEMAVAG